MRAGPLLLALALALGAGAASAQTQPSPQQGAPAPAPQAAPAPQGQAPADPQRVADLALSSAVLQGRIAAIAAGRDTRPEVKRFAQDMAAYRAGQIETLKAFIQERGLKVPGAETFEHQVILDNLEPLDFLALSRRYAEVQVQALEQEIGIYQAAGTSPDEAVRRLGAEMVPELERRLAGAREAQKAAGP